MEIFKCSGCGFTAELKRTKRHGRSDLKFYLDQEGRLVYGKKCHACRLFYRRKHYGQVPKFELKNCTIAKGAEAEMKAARSFEELGFSVAVNESPRGPDLICSIGALSWSVEVKSAIFGGNKSSYFVQFVHPKRKDDDLIAFVLPNGRVYIDSMEHHLKRCYKSGVRLITPIVKEFGLTEGPA